MDDIWEAVKVKFKEENVEKQDPDVSTETLITAMKQIAEDFDLIFNHWLPRGMEGRYYLNRNDRTAVCWMESNCSKCWISKNIGEKLNERIREAFVDFIVNINAFYKED